ncbi:MAG: DMT family transporter [Alphaproteobacteria bacterium]|nr:DMT family transporter [Alphaproteobacteria bacterium]
MTHNISTADVIKGLVSGLLATLFMSLTSVFAKEAAQYHHQVEIVFFRHLFSFFFILIFTGLFLRNIKALKPVRFRTHIVRAVLGSTTMFFLFYAVKYLSLAEASSLFLTGPLFLTILSWPILGERVGFIRISGVIVGLAGAWLIIQPAHISSFTGALLALASGFFSGLVMLTLRWMGRTEPPLVTVFWFATLGLAMMSVFLPFFWSTPTSHSLILMAGIGFFASLLQYFQSLSYVKLPAITAGSLMYTMLIWSFFLDLIIWGVVPDKMIILGGITITASNIAILLRSAHPTKPSPDYNQETSERKL